MGKVCERVQKDSRLLWLAAYRRGAAATLGGMFPGAKSADGRLAAFVLLLSRDESNT